MGALLSGGMAGKCVADAIESGKPNDEGLRPYKDWWDKAFYNHKHYSKRNRKPWRDQLLSSYSMGKVLDNDEINYLFAKVGGSTVMPAVMNPYVSGDYLAEAVGPLVPGIVEEKPSVLAGMKRLEYETPLEYLKEECHPDLVFPGENRGSGG